MLRDFLLFLQKTKPLFIHIPNIYLGLGFDFGPQRFRHLALHGVSIVRGHDPKKIKCRIALFLLKLHGDLQ